MNIKFFDVGASYGLANSENDGLYQFKSGWSNTKLMVYLCGCILDNEKYNELNQLKNINKNDYFPEYRFGEFL